jgi:hypothetical protein
MTHLIPTTQVLIFAPRLKISPDPLKKLAFLLNKNKF